MRTPRSSLAFLGELVAPRATRTLDVPGQMLVVDTNIVRSIVMDRRDTTAFVSFVRDGGTIHIPDGAIVELLSWLHRTSHAWSAWKERRRELEAFIDNERPMLMGGRELLARAGILLEAPASTLMPNDQMRLNREVWQQLLTSTTLSDVGHPRMLVETPRGPAELAWDASGASQQVARQRASWIDTFGKYNAAAAQEGFNIKGRTVPRELLEQQATNLGRFLDMRSNSTPPASVRLDAMIRVYILLSLRSLQTRERYDPTKNANDAFDLDLYRYLALPAAVCTGDLGIIKDTRSAGSWQAEWVVMPEELADSATRQRLLNLTWPSRSGGGA